MFYSGQIDKKTIILSVYRQRDPNLGFIHVDLKIETQFYVYFPCNYSRKN